MIESPVPSGPDLQVGIYPDFTSCIAGGGGLHADTMKTMRDFKLRSDLQRVVLDGYALPLGVERLDAPPPLQGYLVDFVASEGEEPDTYAFQVATSHEGLRPLLLDLFELLPGEVAPVVEIGSVDAYRSIDVYMAGEPVFIDDFMRTWNDFEPILLEEVSLGVGATAEEPFLEVFLDAWKTITIHCQTDLRDDVESILERHGLGTVSRIWLEDAFDEIDPPYRMREILVMEDEHSPDLDELLLQLRADWGLQLDVDPSSNVDDGGRELGHTLWHAIAMADPAEPKSGGAYISIWATARSLDEAEELVEAAVEGSGDWIMAAMYSIERVAHDERPDELAELSPRHGRTEVHSIVIDEWGEGEAPDEPGGSAGPRDSGGSGDSWGTPGGRLSN